MIKTTAKKAEVDRRTRHIGQTSWLVTAETADGKVFESLMVFRDEPLPKDILYYFERRPEMFRERTS